MSDFKEKRDKVTKEFALFLTPLVAAYLFITFYESGYTSFYGIPHYLISINITDIVLTNRMTLMAAVLAFLWIALYYNVLPSANSPLFKGMITFIVLLALALGFFFGKNDAQKKVEFLVINSTPEQVVLKIYDDKLITAPFDRKTKTIERIFLIGKVGSDSHLMYSLENVGPLTPR